MRNRKKHITELENTAEFLRQEIEKARQELEGEPLTVAYDHGGGQSGVRENPAHTAFAKMLKSYQAVVTQLESMTKDEQETKVVTLAGNSRWKRRA